MSVVLWFTGLSGSGKTTLAETLKKNLVERDLRVDILDGDEVRRTITSHLGFTREDIQKNVRIVAEIARERSVQYDIVIVSTISPSRSCREWAREIVGEHFYEVFIDCPFSVCEARDVKGLYRRARTGEIKNFIGTQASVPYEKPENPDVVIHTDTVTVEEGARQLIEAIKRKNSF